MMWIWQKKDWPDIKGDFTPETVNRLEAALDKLEKMPQPDIDAIIADEVSASQAIENIFVSPKLCRLCLDPRLHRETYAEAAMMDFGEADPDNPQPLADIVNDAEEAGLRKLPVKEQIKFWHGHLMKFGHNNEGVTPGQFRRTPVGVYGNGRLVYLAPPAEKVENEMASFCSWLDNWENSEKHSALDIFRTAALAHFRFAAIHPFGDGNGRTARLIDMRIRSFLPHGLYFSMAKAINEDRNGYYRALQKAQVGNSCDASFFINWHGETAANKIMEQ